MTMAAAIERDGEAIRRFIERFAAALTETGWPRMPARVFVALFANDEGRMTAAELAEKLQVSPAAISGAVRFLGQLGLTTRERDPGTRRDVYRVHDSVWYEAIARRDQVFDRWNASLLDGINVLGAGTPAGTRLEDTLDLFNFLREEMPHVYERWQAQKAARTPAPAAPAPSPMRRS
jgi:DNA-binding MarR family transcriptional regulator